MDGAQVYEKTRKDASPLSIGRCDIGNSIPPFRESGNAGPRKKGTRHGTFPFVGLIDEFAVLTRALDQAEIESLWRAGSQVPVP